MLFYYNLQSLSFHSFSLLSNLLATPPKFRHVSLVALSKYWQNAFQEPGRHSVHPDTLLSWQMSTQLKSLLPTSSCIWNDSDWLIDTFQRVPSSDLLICYLIINPNKERSHLPPFSLYLCLYTGPKLFHVHICWEKEMHKATPSFIFPCLIPQDKLNRFTWVFHTYGLSQHICYSNTAGIHVWIPWLLDAINVFCGLNLTFQWIWNNT